MITTGSNSAARGAHWYAAPPGGLFMPPRAGASAPLNIGAADQRREMPRGAETILLAEDEEMLRALAREVLEMNGYTVLAAANGAEALQLCAQHQGLIHLLLTDVIMPEMSGYTLAEHLQHLRPEMRVLYMSGYTSDAIVHHGVPDESVNFIQKPFTPDALALKVRAVLDAA